MSEQLVLDIDVMPTFVVGDRVKVSHQYFDNENEVWLEVPGDVHMFTGQVVAPPAPPSAYRGIAPERRINVMPDEPYPSGDPYASEHPVYVPTTRYKVGNILFRSVVEPLPDTAE